MRSSSPSAPTPPTLLALRNCARRGREPPRATRGYCLQQAGDDAGAIAAFTQLVRERPESRHVAEAWLRTGEVHFDHGSLDEAARAYERVVALRRGPLVAPALYKLGWSHYRADRYASAVSAFERLIVLADADGGGTAQVLRPEAVQYLAICLAEPDWDGDGEADAIPAGSRTPTVVVARAEALIGRPGKWWREVAEAVGDVLALDALAAEAVAVYRQLIDGAAPDARARLEGKMARLQPRVPEETP